MKLSFKFAEAALSCLLHGASDNHAANLGFSMARLRWLIGKLQGRPLMIWGAEEIEKKKIRMSFSRRKKMRGTLQEIINFERHSPGKSKKFSVVVNSI